MTKRIHYPNLNALRFIAAFIVVIHHTEQIKFLKGLPNIWGNPIVELLGKLGVNLFFVLSGFLITSLLFIEKDSVPEISIKNFIIRRVLRIWPLYFIIMIIAFFITPHFSALQLSKPFVDVSDHYLYNIVLYVLFLPHIQIVVLGPILYCSQAWSIGIEEQFYFMWPFLVKYLNVKKLTIFIISFVVAYLLFCIVLYYISNNIYTDNNGLSKLLRSLLALCQNILKFDCLLIGGMFAIINNNLKVRNFFTSKIFQLSCYIAEGILIYTAFNFYGFYWEIHAILYGFIIFNLVRSDTSIINLDFQIFNFLGRISYGIYMYHILIINCIVTLFFKYQISYLVYPAIFALVVLISIISYNSIERYFLKKKIQFSSIMTG